MPFRVEEIRKNVITKGGEFHIFHGTFKERSKAEEKRMKLANMGLRMDIKQL